jgi:asparagine synthase (glutamine-hydrolysing)
MCGISGILGFGDSFAVSESLARDMAAAQSHRGPDDHGAWAHSADRVALSHRRLSIIDLSAAGHQPMSNEDGSVWITYNGEVYNHEALRGELEAKGHTYRSRTDTETILHLYEEEGPDCVARLDGMFAFAIWDARRRQLLLARDRLGVKPLLYALLPQGLVFGSEVRAILRHPAVHAELDEDAFYDYLTFAFAPPPRTLFKAIHKLSAAEYMTIDATGSSRRKRYWCPWSAEASTAVRAMDEEEMVSRTRALLTDSIEKRMMSDVPFGVFLSGGVDSSTNVALMAERSSQPIRTFSTAPAGHPRYDELAYARMIVERFGTDHHEVVIGDEDLAAYIPELIEHQDEPTSDWTAIPQHFVTKLARDTGTPVVQVGEGADEIFHGYKGYADHRRFVVPFQTHVPAWAQRPIGDAAVWLTQRLGRGIRQGEAIYDAAASPVPYWGGALCFRGPLKDRIVRDGARWRDSRQIPEAVWSEAERDYPGADLFQKMTYVELKQRLSELLLMRLDRITMASSVEGRDPFLDHRLVEFAVALPPGMKNRDGNGKYVLKRAMRGTLPDEILDRRKQGFGTPMPEWLRGGFGELAERTVRMSALRERGLLDMDQVVGLFAAHRAGRGDWSYHLWNLYSVSAWYDRWVAGRPA